MFGQMREDLRAALTEIRGAGLCKAERVIASPQNAKVRVRDGAEVLNFCANNYLGLADHPAVVAAAKAARAGRCTIPNSPCWNGTARMATTNY